jgi:hypothetical protein
VTTNGSTRPTAFTRTPVQATKSLTGLDTSTSPRAASVATRALIWTAIPAIFVARDPALSSMKASARLQSQRLYPQQAQPTARAELTKAAKARRRVFDFAASKASEFTTNRQLYGHREDPATGSRQAPRGESL